jgi:hypothetical protein
MQTLLNVACPHLTPILTPFLFPSSLLQGPLQPLHCPSLRYLTQIFYVFRQQISDRWDRWGLTISVPRGCTANHGRVTPSWAPACRWPGMAAGACVAGHGLEIETRWFSHNGATDSYLRQTLGLQARQASFVPPPRYQSL